MVLSVDNQRVTEWRDKSGNNHHMLPLAGSVIFRGDLSGNFMEFGGGSLTYEGGQNILKDGQKDHSLFIVLESSSDSGSWTNPIAFQRNASTNGYRLERTDNESWMLLDLKCHPPKLNPFLLKIRILLK